MALYLGNSIIQYLLFLGVLASAVIAGKIVTWLSKTIVRSFASKTRTKVDDLLVEVLEAPVLFSIFLVALWVARSMLNWSDSALRIYNTVLSVLIIVNVAWYLARFIKALVNNFIEPLAKKSETDFDDHLLPLIKKLTNIIIFTIAGVMIIDKLGYDISTLVAGLGIGGLAFALAAQDLVANLFGGVAILVDRPFKLGDRVRIGDIDGFVREIGLRTTRIETFGGTMIVLPNSKVVNSSLENISAERERRMLFTIGVEYDTSAAKLERAKKIIEKNIRAVDGLNHEDFDIHFVEFADSSLNIRVQYWITPEGMKDYFGVQDRLLTGIKKDFEKAKIEMAYPTQTVYVKK